MDTNPPAITRKKLENSHRLLDDYINSIRKKPFEWGKHDCALHAANAVLALTGDDPAAEWRGKYDTANTAMRIIGCGVEELPERVGLTPLPSVKFARAGDIVLYRMDGHPCLGVCLGGNSCFTGKTEAQFINTLDCEKAWRI